MEVHEVEFKYLTITKLVGSSQPRAEEGSKGAAVLCLRRYVSWVKNDVNQFGSYLLRF
jgi:hypothetical protein